jgi:hypothetical protein
MQIYKSNNINKIHHTNDKILVVREENIDSSELVSTVAESSLEVELLAFMTWMDKQGNDYKSMTNQFWIDLYMDYLLDKETK